MRHLRILRRVVLVATSAFLVVRSVGFAQLIESERPIPNEASQKSASQLIQEVYADNFQSAKTPVEKLQLAQKLLTVARETTRDFAGQFVLLAKVRELAVELGDVDLAMLTVDEASKTFAIDTLAWKTESLALMERDRKLNTPAQQVLFVETALSLVEQSIAEDAYDSASQLTALARKIAQKARNSGLEKQATQLRTEVSTLRSEFKQVQEAKAKLKEDPLNPDANLAVGRYYCFSKADWDVGLLMLALGSDAQLKKLADHELQRPEESAEQVMIGDSWWEIAKGMKTRQKKIIHAHAATWYRNALPNLAGLHKAKVEKRLREAPSSSLLGHSLISLARGLVGHWKLDEGRGDRAVNSAGNAHGKLHGNPTWTKGRIGGALSLDGKDDWVEVGEYPTLQRYTVSLFAFISERQVQGTGTVLSLRAEENSEYDSSFFNFALTARDDTSNKTAVFALDPPGFRAEHNVLGTGWRHIAASYDGREYKIYVDGAPVRSLIQGPPRTDGKQTLLFGSEPDYGNPRGRFRFNGVIDDIQIYNRALSDAEVRSLYDSVAVLPR